MIIFLTWGSKESYRWVEIFLFYKKHENTETVGSKAAFQMQTQGMLQAFHACYFLNIFVYFCTFYVFFLHFLKKSHPCLLALEYGMCRHILPEMGFYKNVSTKLYITEGAITTCVFSFRNDIMRMAATAILYFMFFNFSNNRVFYWEQKFTRKRRSIYQVWISPSPFRKRKRKKSSPPCIIEYWFP